MILNDEVEIIEDPKKIKKLPKEITDNACATRDQKIIANKIDELIDEINKLKEEKWIENFIEKTQKEG